MSAGPDHCLRHHRHCESCYRCVIARDEVSAADVIDGVEVFVAGDSDRYDASEPVGGFDPGFGERAVAALEAAGCFVVRSGQLLMQR